MIEQKKKRTDMTMTTNTKVTVATREEALALIAGGTNSMLVFSPEALYGYRKDGTPAGRRGRHALSAEVVAEREATRAARAVTGRAKTGPIVRTPEAPFGVKKDGSPMLKRGRPSLEATLARRAAKAAERALKKIARAEKKAAKAAALAAAAAAPLAPVTEPAAPEAIAEQAPLAEVAIETPAAESEALTG